MAAIYVRFARLRSWFLCRYIFAISRSAASTSLMRMIWVSTVSCTLSIVIGNLLLPWSSTKLVAWLLCSRLTRSSTINVINIFLESICDLCLLLLPFSAMMMSVSLLGRIGLLMMSIRWWCLSPSVISAITLEVFLRLLSTNFSSTLPRLISYTWRGFDMRSRSTCSSASGMVKGSILLNKIYSWFHCWRALTISSAVTMTLSDMGLASIMCTRRRITRCISVIVSVILLLYIVKIRITIEIAIACPWSFLDFTCGQFFECGSFFWLSY